MNDQEDLGQPEDDYWDNDDNNEDVKMPDHSGSVNTPAKDEDMNYYEEKEDPEQQSYLPETAQHDYENWDDQAEENDTEQWGYDDPEQTGYNETWNSAEAEYGTSYSDWATQDWSNHQDGYANDCNLADQDYDQIDHEEQLNEQYDEDYDNHNGHDENDYEDNDYGEEEDYDNTW